MANKECDKNMNWSLLAKYFTNEANSSEAQEVEAWCDSSNQNKKIFLQVYSSWKLSNVDRIDEKQAWRKVEKNLHLQRKKIVTMLPLFYKIAASLLIIAALIYGLNKRTDISTPIEELIIVESSNKQIKIELTDGSVVHLNKNSILKYPHYFKNKERKVFIDGEGFFEVTKKENLPFIVSTKNLKIKVVGTSFNVEAFSSKLIANVIVKTGKVSILGNNSNTKKHLLLSKNEMATLDKAKGTLSKSSLDNNNHLAWKTGILKFDQIKLDEVVKIINKVYDTKIIFNNDNPKPCLLTAQFNNRPLEEVVDVIATTFKLRVEWTPTKIILYGESCN